MSDNTNTGGAGDQNSGGAGSGEGGKGSVSYETYSRTMDELKSLKGEIKTLKEQGQKSHEDKLKEQNDWKALAEAREAKVKELESKNSNIEESIADSIKLNAFQKHLGGKLKSDKYFSFVDTAKIVLNPETKKVDEDSVKAVVASFVKEHAHLVEFGKKPGMPRDSKEDTTKISNGKKSVEQMSAKEMEEHILDLAKRGLIK